MRKVVFLALIFVFSASVFAQAPAGFDLSNYGVRIEPDRRVMIVLATLEAARTTDDKGNPVRVLDTKLSAEGTKFRDQLSSDSAALNEDLRQRISNFVIQHKRRNTGLSDSELVGQFISMAYALGPAPEFADPVVTIDLPGRVLDVLDFAPLVREFYRRSSFSGNLNEYIKSYQKSSDGQLRNSTREMVSDLLGYLQTRPQIFVVERVKTETQKSGSKKTTLKNVETRERERRFFIVPEMLAPAGYVHFLNIKDDYFVVLPPDTDVTFSELRRGFLQFVVDPIVLNNAKDIQTIAPGVKALLDERRKTQPDVSPDVYLTISRSLVAAVDAKQAEALRIRIATEASRKKITDMGGKDETGAIAKDLEKYKQEQADETILRLSEDYEKGAVLVFYFADQLKGSADSGFDIAASFREMILALDAPRESTRYAGYADVRNRAIAARKERRTQTTAVIPIENPVTTRLIEIQETIDARDYSKASADLTSLLKTSPNEPRVHYNLARVASLAAEGLTDGDEQNAKLREAKAGYEKVVQIFLRQRQEAAAGKRVENPVDGALVSLSYVALGKIYEFYDQKDYAVRIYDAAIALGDIPRGAFQQALAAKARLVKQQ